MGLKRGEQPHRRPAHPEITHHCMGSTSPIFPGTIPIHVTATLRLTTSSGPELMSLLPLEASWDASCAQLLE